MKANIWMAKKKVTLYIGGDPLKNEPPLFTIEIDNPQIAFDSDKYTVQITETK